MRTPQVAAPWSKHGADDQEDTDNKITQDTKHCANCGKELWKLSVSELCPTCSAVFNVDHAYTDDDLIDFGGMT